MLLLLPLALANEPRLVVAHIAFPEGVRASSARVELLANEDSLELTLTDDGRSPSDAPSDNIWTAQGELDYARWTTVSLYAALPGEPERLLYQGYESSDELGPLRFGWAAFEQPDGLQVRRSVAGWPGASMPVDSQRPLLVSFGWGAIVLIWVGVLAALRMKRSR